MTKPSAISIDDTLGTAFDGLPTGQFEGPVPEPLDTINRLETQLLAYESAFLEHPVPVVVYASGTLQILDVNHSAVELYGYTRKEICSLNLLDLFESQADSDPINLAEELRKPRNSIGPVAQRSAARRELIVTMVSASFSLHGIDARLALVQDETLRHTVQDALRASEERFRELFENANDVIVLHDLKGRVIAINRAGETLTGYTRAELIGRPFEKLVAPEARSLTQDCIRAHLGGSPIQRYELPVVSKMGTRRYLDVSTRIIYQKGHAFAVQGICRDITDRKQAQQRLLESAQELQNKNQELSTALRLAREATQLKEQFLANTSHELRTPMNGIMGMINLLKSTDLTADQREYAEVVSQCANDLLTIINDLLDLSQIGARKLSLDYEAVDIRESLRAVVKLLNLRAEAKGLRLNCEVDPAAPHTIWADSVRFRQILTNLIANALKFTSAGEVNVTIKAGKSDHDVRFEVSDTGIGVEEQLRDRIFEAFFQADGTNKRRFGGTGLGLTICKQLVELMGGRIGMYNNQLGQGSTFWFELPVERPEPPMLETPAGTV